MYIYMHTATSSYKVLLSFFVHEYIHNRTYIQHASYVCFLRAGLARKSSHARIRKYIRTCTHTCLVVRICTKI